MIHSARLLEDAVVVSMEDDMFDGVLDKIFAVFCEDQALNLRPTASCFDDSLLDEM